MTVNIALGLAAGRSTVEGDELSREQLARAERSLSNVRTLVEGLLEFARSGARPAPGATALVDQVVRTVADDCTPLVEDVGARIEVEADDASSVACSSGVLMSLVGNLMHNALRSVRGQPERRVTVRAHTEGDFVRLEVSDTGPGVHPALRDSLFEPHVQGPDHGRLGLGLATVKRLIDSHGGRVGFENRAGHGATFWFELPAARADRTKHP